MLEEQLQLQRQFTEKIMKEEQESHKKEVEKLKELHAEELARKLELRNLEI
jgi:pyruvate-formate lyase-activating enzyme